MGPVRLWPWALHPPCPVVEGGPDHPGCGCVPSLSTPPKTLLMGFPCTEVRVQRLHVLGWLLVTTDGHVCPAGGILCAAQFLAPSDCAWWSQRAGSALSLLH